MRLNIDDIIELVNGRKYIVVDKLEENNNWYYYVYEVNNNTVLDNSMVVEIEMKNAKMVITQTAKKDIEKKFKARIK